MPTLRACFGYLMVAVVAGSTPACHHSSASRGSMGRQFDALAARASFTRWNLETTYEAALRRCRSSGSTRANQGNCGRALELASRSHLDLESLMERQPAPPLALLHGKWFGINKGLGAAAIGLTQDIKVFQTESCPPRGYNLAVHQVPIDQLACRGFQAVESPFHCDPNSIGNFAIIEPCLPCQPVKLDYTRVANSFLNPSKRLIDELVMIDHDLLLGRANVSMGKRLMPIAYFVLYRGSENGCDTLCDHDSACDDETACDSQPEVDSATACGAQPRDGGYYDGCDR